jgi:biopolymer transport protein ExbD
MLVLLVMFIISIPTATHKVPLDLPANGPGDPAPVHQLDLDADGRCSGTGARSADADLTRVARPDGGRSADPELHIASDGETRYETGRRDAAAIGRAGITRMGFIGNERFAEMMD